jgi:hypothetical protein
MISIELNFTQRLKLSDLLSVQEGPLGRTAPFLRVLNLVRFDDAESPQIKVQQVSETLRTYMAPTIDFGERSVELESADANALQELLNSWPKLTTVDHIWADPIVEQLQAKETTSKTSNNKGKNK